MLADHLLNVHRPAADQIAIDAEAARAPALAPYHCRTANGCRSCSDQLPADQKTPDLAGTCTDVVQFRIAQITLDRPILGIAGPAERLDRLQAAAHGILARQQDRAG